MKFTPSYIDLLNSGVLEQRAAIADALLKSCTCCPHSCQIDRTTDEPGKCLSGYLPVVSSFTPHFGEEPVLSGTRGAGNIFFGNCNLKCTFCQNYEISQNWKAEKNNEVSFEKLAEIMIELQNKNCHNIGFVSPTHFSAQILKAVFIAVQKGLRLPIIYNTNGYDSVDMLRLFEGIADIYLPDFKYGSNEYARTYSKIPSYFDKTKEAVREMFRQVGDELIYEDGIVVRGLIIRHLVLPNDIADTEIVLKFISEELSNEVHISLMSQYFPANKAKYDILIDRTIRESEYDRVLDLLEKYNLKNGWIQEMASHNNYKPEFNNNRQNPFNNK